MLLNALVAAGLLCLSTAIETSLDSLSQNPNVLHRRQRSGGAVRIGPKPPFKPMPASTPRTRECVVKSGGGSGDDTANILDAIKTCNDGGRVVFPKSAKYLVGKAMDLSNLKHIDLGTRTCLLSNLVLHTCETGS
jgi:polygalacturonase